MEKKAADIQKGDRLRDYPGTKVERVYPDYDLCYHPIIVVVLEKSTQLSFRPDETAAVVEREKSIPGDAQLLPHLRRAPQRTAPLPHQRGDRRRTRQCEGGHGGGLRQPVTLPAE